MPLYTYMPPVEALPRPLGHLPDLEAISWAIRPSGRLPAPQGHLAISRSRKATRAIFLGHKAISVGHKAISLGHKAVSQSHQVFPRAPPCLSVQSSHRRSHRMLTKPPDGIPMPFISNLQNYVVVSCVSVASE